MNLSFNRKMALGMIRQLRVGRRRVREMRVIATGGHLYFETPLATASSEALVLEPGAFLVGVEPFAQLLRSYAAKDSLTLTADAGHFRLDNFKGQVRAYDPAPKLADDAPPPEPDDASLEPDPQSWARL